MASQLPPLALMGEGLALFLLSVCKKKFFVSLRLMTAGSSGVSCKLFYQPLCLYTE
jgi:hypothetical protein